jgi:hypothetical protein
MGSFRIRSLKLLDQVTEVMRFKHYSIRTERTYREWIKRFILFHGKRHPREMGSFEIERFLSDLAVRGRLRLQLKTRRSMRCGSCTSMTGSVLARSYNCDIFDSSIQFQQLPNGAAQPQAAVTRTIRENSWNSCVHSAFRTPHCALACLPGS